MNILIVDDARVMRQQLRLCLETGGFQVTDASSGEEGLQKAQLQRPDLIVSDFNMPGIDGLEMVRQLRKLAGYEKVPIFMLTTESSAEMVAAGKLVGVTAWIVKPFKPDLMLLGISKVLSR